MKRFLSKELIGNMAYVRRMSLSWAKASKRLYLMDMNQFKIKIIYNITNIFIRYYKLQFLQEILHQSAFVFFTVRGLLMKCET